MEANCEQPAGETSSALPGSKNIELMGLSPETPSRSMDLTSRGGGGGGGADQPVHPALDHSVQQQQLRQQDAHSSMTSKPSRVVAAIADADLDLITDLSDDEDGWNLHVDSKSDASWGIDREETDPLGFPLIQPGGSSAPRERRMEMAEEEQASEAGASESPVPPPPGAAAAAPRDLDGYDSSGSWGVEVSACLAFFYSVSSGVCASLQEDDVGRSGHETTALDGSLPTATVAAADSTDGLEGLLSFYRQEYDAYR